MNWKHRILGIGSALLLSLAIVGPATAQIGTLDVSVEVNDVGTGMDAQLAAGSSADFGTVDVEAAGAVGTGLVDAGSITLSVEYINDTMLYRDGSFVNIKLGNGNPSDAFLDLISGDPGFTGADQVDFQIPGRYLTISAMNNPQQLKWTNPSGTSTGPIWTNDMTVNNGVGRVPRVAGSTTTGQAIYKVGDIGGTFGPGCDVTTGSAMMPWPGASCGANDFGESGGASHRVAYIYPGSGFVSAAHAIELSLQIPAGVYMGTYQGTLTVEQVTPGP